jgi:hypothetical protein
MELRLHGTPDEVDQATERLAEVFDVVSVSTHRPDRGTSRLVRVYLQLRLTPPRDATSPLAKAEAAKGRRDLPGELDALTTGERHLRAQPWYPLQPGDVALCWLPGIGHGNTYLATNQGVDPDGGPILRQVSSTTQAAQPSDAERLDDSLGDSERDSERESLFELWFEAGPATLTVIRAGQVIFGQPARHQLPNRGQDRGGGS